MTLAALRIALIVLYFMTLMWLKCQILFGFFFLVLGGGIGTTKLISGGRSGVTKSARTSTSSSLSVTAPN